MAAIKVYDDTNYRELLPADFQRSMDKCSRVESPRGKQLMEAAPNFGDTFPVYPRSEWKARIDEQKAKKRRISDFQKFKSHAQTGPTCWANGPAHAYTTQRVIQGLPLVYMSGNSIAVPISGGVSGGDEWEAGEYSLKYGWVSVDHYDNGSRDRSALNSAECQESRLHHKALQLYSLRGFDQFMTAVLMPIPFVPAIAFNWWRHVISGGDPGYDNDGFFWSPRNNWGEDYGFKNDYGFGGYVRLREGKGTPDSGFVYGQVQSSAA